MGKISMAASILWLALVALAVGGGEAAIVEHTFVVSDICS
jgi:hypothetical protein